MKLPDPGDYVSHRDSAGELIEGRVIFRTNKKVRVMVSGGDIIEFSLDKKAPAKDFWSRWKKTNQEDLNRTVDPVQRDLVKEGRLTAEQFRDYSAALGMSAGALERVVETGLIIGNPVVGLGYQINSLFSDEGSAVERGLDHLIENAPSKIYMRLYHGTKPLGRRYFDVMLTAVSLAAGVLSGARMLGTGLGKHARNAFVLVNTGTGAYTGAFNESLNNPDATPASILGAAVVGGGIGYLTSLGARSLRLNPAGSAILSISTNLVGNLSYTGYQVGFENIELKHLSNTAILASYQALGTYGAARLQASLAQPLQGTKGLAEAIPTMLKFGLWDWLGGYHLDSALREAGLGGEQ